MHGLYLDRVEIMNFPKVEYKEIALVAVVYFLAARLGDSLSVSVAYATVVWLPAGIMLPWALLRGSGIWPGIFAGAVLGGVWTYLDPASADTYVPTLIAGVTNGIGELCSSVGVAWILHRVTQPLDIWRSTSSASWFLGLGVGAGSFVCGCIGVGGLLWAGLIPSSQGIYILAAWFTGDAVGVLMLAPFAIAVARGERFRAGLVPSKEAVSNLVLITLVIYGTFWAGVDGIAGSFALFSLPVLVVWAALRLSAFYASIAIAWIAASTITSTALGLGPFSFVPVNTALINVQLMVGVIGLLVLLLKATREQVRRYVANLEEAKSTLDDMVKVRTSQLEQAIQRANDLASTDPLTGMPNRRVFFARGDEEVNRSQRSGVPASIIMQDIDHFKSINDRFGHKTGDQVIKDVANAVNGQLRSYDVFARIGGEEFAVLLPQTIQTDAAAIAEGLRSAPEMRRVSEHLIQYTASFGVASVHPDDEGISGVLHRADLALYNAKRAGRNQVAVYADEGGISASG